MMAKVTDLNGCFVRVNGDTDFIQKVLDSARPDDLSGDLSSPRVERIYFRRNERYMIADFFRVSPQVEFKEIYLHDDYFYDEPVVSDEFELLGIQWDSNQPDELKVGSWQNGDHCIWCGTDAVFIGYSASHKSRCAIEYLEDNCSKIDTVLIEDISKPETEAEKKTRELAEKVNAICLDILKKPAHECSQTEVDIIELMVKSGYKKAD